MAKLTDDQVVNVVDAINIFDKKGDGKLPIHKMLDCLRSLGVNPLESEVSKIVNEIIEYHNESRVEVEDFLPIYEYFLNKRKTTVQELCDGLKSLDPSKSDVGTIAETDLRIALTTIGDKLTDKECSFILDQVKDANNEVNIEKLVHLVTGEKLGDEEDEEMYLAVPKSSKIGTAQIKQQLNEDVAVSKTLEYSNRS